MSKLANLIGKSKTYTIGEVELEFKPLKFEHINLLAELEDESKRVDAMKKIIAITLKAAVQDATDEEIANLGITYLKQITDAIVEVNGLTENVSKKD